MKKNINKLDGGASIKLVPLHSPGNGAQTYTIIGPLDPQGFSLHGVENTESLRNFSVFFCVITAIIKVCTLYILCTMCNGVTCNKIWLNIIFSIDPDIITTELIQTPLLQN